MEDLSNVPMSLKRNNRLMLDSRKYKGKCFDLCSPIAVKNLMNKVNVLKCLANCKTAEMLLICFMFLTLNLSINIL